MNLCGPLLHSETIVLLASTEYVTMTGTMLGPDLPMALFFHAMVAINSTCSMVIGGSSYGYSASTFFYDRNEGEWINGPSLMQARGHHAAGIVTDEVTDETFVAVTGGFGSVGLFTEILQDGEWVQGKISDSTMVYANPITVIYPVTPTVTDPLIKMEVVHNNRHSKASKE